MSNENLSVPPTEAPPSDLQVRISQRRAELLRVLADLKTDIRLEAAESRIRVKARLSELAHVVKWGVADGWASVAEPVTEKLQVWLTESAHQVPRRFSMTEPALTAVTPAAVTELVGQS